MFPALADPIFHLTQHSWPMLDWDLEMPHIINDKRIASQGVDLNCVMSGQLRIAALPVMCDNSTDFAYDPASIDIDLSKFDLVLLSDIEFRSIKDIQSWINKRGIRNYLLSVGGLHAGETLDPESMIYRPWWAFNLLKFNNFQELPNTNRPYMFEMLLGARRPHRDFALMGLEQIGQLESSIANYRKIFIGGFTDRFTDKYARYFDQYDIKLRYPYVSPNLNPEWEPQKEVASNNISPYVPWEIYRRTNYSVVCETLGVGETFFLSEKTAKALWAKRIFVVFSVCNFLKNLREIGFKTFGDIIDESYDQEHDNVRRFSMIVKQMQDLARQDPVKLYDQVWPILEHNHQTLAGLEIETTFKMHELLRKKLSKLN